MRWFLRYKNVILVGTLIILAECFVIYDYDRVRTDFRALKAFLRETKASRLVKCKNCGKEIAVDAGTCPHCGGFNFSSWIVVSSAVILLFLFLAFISGGFGGLLLP